MGEPGMIRPGEGESFDLGRGVSVVIKVSGESTGGLFSVVEHPVEPGGLVENHTHTNEDECFYVSEGEVGVQVGEEIMTAQAGAVIYAPRGIEHAFWNAGSTPARVIHVYAPAGFERFFAQTVGLVAPDGSFDEEGFERLAQSYGMSFDFERAEELAGRYGLRSQ
jgi:quercetin dioxygenase-like cupin family protein